MRVYSDICIYKFIYLFINQSQIYVDIRKAQFKYLAEKFYLPDS